MARAEEIKDFVASAGWSDSKPENMESGFSPRRYTRLHKPDGSTAVLLDADPDQKTHQYIVLAWLLRNSNLSAPQIIAERDPQGLVLMEDFGEANVGRLIDHGADPIPYYQNAAAVLVHLHKNFALTSVQDLKLPRFTAAVFAKQTEKFLDSYMPHVSGKTATEDQRKSFLETWLKVLKPVDDLPQSLLLRDYMPDNVMDIPDRQSWRALGLLDFQDAGIGPIAYDVASFCEVVRRDGGDAQFERMVRNYADRAKPACGLDALRHGCLLLSAQRHARILGILAGMAQKGRAEKAAFLPRTEAYFKHLLGEESLRPVKEWMKAAGLLA